MAQSIITECVSKVIEKLVSKAFKEIMNAKDLDSKIKRLQQFKTTIEATIRDARSKSCTDAEKDMLEKFDCALADLDYFLDATAAKAKQKEIMHGNKFTKEVRLFFSKSNQLVSPFINVHKLKGIFEQFESISQDYRQFGAIISVPSVNKTQAVSAGSLWSNCHILTEMVIGRDKDREEIVSMLLDDSLSSQTLSVASIVGIGGVGKTTLAKYAYHDERVKCKFDVRFWVSTTQDFDVQKVLLKILATFEYQKTVNCDIVQMYDYFQRAICRKKFLLVLDNVWDQESLWQKWQDLKSLLALGANGSKVLLTTRNEKVASIMDCCNPYLLGDLKEEDSWLLFQNIAFTQCRDPSLEAIGREIVQMCPNVPLVIRSIGGLLAGKCTVMEWQAFRDDQLANFSAYGHDIMQTLKLSYDQLDERLKLCVAYYSLLPKGKMYYKYVLIDLWISLGYIKASYERQRLEDAAEECILKLAIQGFIIQDECYLGMHDLIHDFVVSIADFKYKLLEVNTCEIDERVRHLSIDPKVSKMEKVLSSIFKLKQLQSLLVSNRSTGCSKLYVINKLFYIFPRLRILILSNLGIENVPNSLGELISLRFLDLSCNPITRLPNSITKLVELLSLGVSCCEKLDEFPKGIRKLVKLRHFRNTNCPALLPKGVTSLTDLQTLNEFPLKFSDGFPRESDCGLAELNIINRLTRGITIKVIGDANSRCFKANEEHWESKGNLVCLILDFEEGSTKGDEKVIEVLQLQPNINLRNLEIKGYKGERLPRWIKDGIHYFQNLNRIWLENLEGCRSLGSFGRLLHLKWLRCKHLGEVEYIEENYCGGNNPLFPSLKQLDLVEMPKLKKWYMVSSNESSCNILLAPKLGFPKLDALQVDIMEFVISMTREFRGLPSLKTLEIFDCGDLKAIPDGIPNLSNLKDLWLGNCSSELKERCREPNGEDWPKIKHIPDVYIH